MLLRRAAQVALAVLLGSCIAGCDTGLPGAGPPRDGGPLDAIWSSTCLEGLDAGAARLTWIQPKVFSRSCALSGSCHTSVAMGGPATPQMGLDLYEGQSFSHLVNICARERAQLLVHPGDPDDSYLLIKLGGVPGEVPEVDGVCVEDRCNVPGMPPVVCTGVNEVCLPIDGECHEDKCPPGHCMMGDACVPETGSCVPDPCADETCPAASVPQICVVGIPYMPLNADRLCGPKIHAVRRWITNLGDAGPYTDPDGGGLLDQPVCCDQVQNGDETDLDCGGTCPGCADGKMCGDGNDCTSLVCLMSVCQVPTCTDTVKNDKETDVDCGGATSCPRCADGLKCKVGGDCSSNVCKVTCQPCTDMLLNGSETDVDCGGFCENCANGKLCLVNTDCESNNCVMGTCEK